MFSRETEDKSPWVMIDYDKSHWEVSCTKDFPSFLRALSGILPSDSVLYIEVGSPADEIKKFFESCCLVGKPIIPMGTTWPKPEFFHLPVNSENLFGLADIAEKYPEFEIAYHVHVHKNNALVLQWYDAFLDPIHISKDIPEDRIKEFCSKLNIEYQETKSV